MTVSLPRVVRVPRGAIDALRSLVEEHLRQEYTWLGGDSLNDTEVDEWELVEFLYAALEYVRDAHPFMGRRGAVVDSSEAARDPANTELFTALLHLESITPDACIAALVSAVPLEIVDTTSGQRKAAPRAYRYFPHDWPDVLGRSVGEREYDFWSENVFGVVGETGWIQDRGKRDKVFAAIDPTYHSLSFVELDRETAHRLACFLLAGAEGRRAFNAFDQQARALISLFGPGSRLFSNRSFNEDELQDPFAHGEPVDLGTPDCCAGGSLLALLVSDGRHVARLEVLWDRWTEM